MNENEIGYIVVDTAVYLHKKLGPGLLETVYEIVLLRLLTKKGLYVQSKTNQYKTGIYSEFWGRANERRNSQNH